MKYKNPDPQEVQRKIQEGGVYQDPLAEIQVKRILHRIAQGKFSSSEGYAVVEMPFLSPIAWDRGVAKMLEQSGFSVDVFKTVVVGLFAYRLYLKPIIKQE